MATKAKHAFGSESKISEALAAGKIDAYDILFLDEKKVGWVTRDGEVVIAEPDLSGVESDISELESAIATKVGAEEVDAKLEQTVSSAKSYTDGKIEAAINEHLVKKYEITSKPVGTLVDYFDKEIRVMCPADTQWSLQNVGENGDATKYYVGFKAYAPNENVVSFKEDLAKTISDTTMYYFEGNDFAGIDEYGRKYSIVWLPVAKYDADTDVWTYYGSNSSEQKYIGWYYSVEWYNADGIVIASDCIRINLSNEECHSLIEPFYMNNAIEIAKTYADEQIEAKIAESSAIEIVEF